MKLLAVSDIHNNLSCVRKLRAQESNSFDAIVVAGDVGNEIASAFFEILGSYKCPILYVYGNWDSKQKYDQNHNPHCVHLHQKLFTLGDLHFSGFSGCSEHWGLNPIAVSIKSELASKHRSVVEKLEEAHKEKAQIEQLAAHQKAKTDRLKRQRQKAINAVEKQIERIYSSKPYKRYDEELKDAAIKGIPSKNRSILSDHLKMELVDPNKTVLVTHSRVFRLHEDFGPIFMHLFGHQHGFKHTVFRGTHCINVSVLDNILGATPVRNAGKLSDSHWRQINAGTYTVIEIGADAPNIVCKQLDRFPERWQVQDLPSKWMGIAWAPEEEPYVLDP